MRRSFGCVALWIVTLVLTGFLSVQAAEPAQNLLPNGDFELGSTEDGLPLQWSLFAELTEGSSVQVSKAYATVGEYSLELIDGSSERSVGVRSMRVSAAPGQIFVVEADVKSISGDAMVYLDFHNANNQRVDVKTITIRGPVDWQTVQVEGIAPEGTTNVSIILYSGVANKGLIYFDNIRLYKFE